MAEYIDRETAIKLLEEHDGNFSDVEGQWWSHGLNAAISHIKELPAADVAPVVHGRWDKCGATRHKNHCTRCGSERPYRKIGRGYYLVWDSPYCPHCGAKMDGGEKDAQVPT